MTSTTNIPEALQAFVESTAKVIEGAEKIIANEGILQLADYRLGSLIGMILNYKTLFQMLGCGTETELMEILGKIQRIRDEIGATEAVDGFFQAESSWEEFLVKADRQLEGATVAARSNEDLIGVEFEPLGSDPSKDKVDLDLETLETLKCQVIIVSFGERKGAEAWRKDTKCKLPIYLDPQRKAYQALGMKRSFSKVWGRTAMIYYAEMMLRQRELPKPVADIHDDPLQMGGDVVLDRNGVPFFTYLSTTSSDRPKVADVINRLQSKSPICQQD